MKRKIIAFILALFFVLGQSGTANAGSSQSRVTPDWGVTVSWKNPSTKPTGYKTISVVFKFSNPNSDKSFNVMHTTLLDRDGTEVSDELSIGEIRPGKSGTVRLSIMGDDLKGTRAPYTISFEFNGIQYENGYAVDNISEISEFGFAFEVPSTITCAKGKTLKKVTAYKPQCPSGYKKK
jgi:hypothetical protein